MYLQKHLKVGDSPLRADRNHKDAYLRFKYNKDINARFTRFGLSREQYLPYQQDKLLAIRCYK